MRRPTAVAGLAMLFPALILMGCSDQPATTEAPRTAQQGSALLGLGSDHAAAIIGHDSCDPASFNAMAAAVICNKPGRTTFQEFIAELAATQTARSWRFNPLQATTHAGEAMLVQNAGGELHTFTPVAQFGGGFIQDLNNLSANPVPAPECLNFSAIEFVPGGGNSLIAAAALANVADASGIARVQCCIHPWMRAEVRIK